MAKSHDENCAKVCVGTHSSAHLCTYCISPASNWDDIAQWRTLQMNSEQFKLWKLS